VPIPRKGKLAGQRLFHRRHAERGLDEAVLPKRAHAAGHALTGITRFRIHPETLLLRCAWCDRFCPDDFWLRREQLPWPMLRLDLVGNPGLPRHAGDLPDRASP
jgi:hypothetical protein